MAKSQNRAWVVFRGRKPGVYHSWDETNEQVTGFSKGRQLGYKTFREASLAWEEWQTKIAAMVAASRPAQPPPAYKNPARAWQESFDPVPPGIKPPVQQPAPVTANHADTSQVHPLSNPWEPSTSQPAPCYYDPPLAEPLMPVNANIKRPADGQIYYPQLQSSGISHVQRFADGQVYYPQLHSPPQTSEGSSSPLLISRQTSNLPKPGSYVDLTSPSPPPPEFKPAIKRSVSYMDFTDKLDDEDRSAKRIMMEIPEFKEVAEFTEVPAPAVLTAEERYELDQLEQRPKPKPNHDETKIELSPEQDQVVNMAMRKNNIFLTGAAGCGKTVTLKEILARLKKKNKGGNVQVVAPTGIAALPLEGKTTYSFAGVSGRPLDWRRKREI